MAGAVDCLDQKNECSQQATWKSVMGYLSLVHTLKHELNIVLDEKVNFDNVALVFSCLPGQFAGYVTCFFTGCQVRSAACPILSQAIKSACYLSYSSPGHKASLLCVLFFHWPRKSNCYVSIFLHRSYGELAVCLYSFTCDKVSLLHVISLLAIRSASRVSYFFTGCKVSLLCVLFFHWP